VYSIGQRRSGLVDFTPSTLAAVGQEAPDAGLAMAEDAFYDS
jgi:hypothetical protein